MGIEVKGMIELQELLKMVPAKMENNIPAILNSAGRKIAEEAQNNHRFVSRSGMAGLEGSVKFLVDHYTLFVYLDNTFTTVNTSKKWPDFDYGWAIHDGTKFWAEDPFLFKAFDNKEEAIQKAIEETAWRILTTL